MISSQKKVAFFLPSLRRGGTEIAMVRVLNQLAEEHPEIDFYLLQHLPEKAKEIAVDPRVQRTVLNGTILTLPLRYRSWLKREKPIAVFSAINHINLINILGCQNTSQKTQAITTIHNHLGEKLRRTGSYWEKKLKPLLLRNILPHSDKVIAVSKEIQRYLVEEIGLNQKKACFIPPPVSVKEVRRLAKSHVSITPAPTERKVVVTAGRLATQKGYAILLNALAMIPEDKRPILWILGDGPLKEELSQLTHNLHLNDDVIFWGHQPNPFPFIKQADCFVLSSLWEGFPLVLLEALTLGIPIASTDCPSGPNEILEGGRYGSLSAANDPSALKEGILQTLEKDWEVEGLQHKAEQWDVAHTAKAYWELIEPEVTGSKA